MAPSEQETEATHRLVRWFREGPDAEDGTLGWMLGMAIWWRMLATGALATAVVVSAVAASAVLDPHTSALASAFVGLVVGGWLVKISPKYNVTKNY